MVGSSVVHIRPRDLFHELFRAYLVHWLGSFCCPRGDTRVSHIGFRLLNPRFNSVVEVPRNMNTETIEVFIHNQGEKPSVATVTPSATLAQSACGHRNHALAG